MQWQNGCTLKQKMPQQNSEEAHKTTVDEVDTWNNVGFVITEYVLKSSDSK